MFSHGAVSQPPPTPLSTPTHRDENTLSIFAATLNSEHTLVVTQHIVRFTNAALLAGGGGFGAGASTEAIWVRAGRQAGGKAVGVETVGWALHSYEVEGEEGSCHASDPSSHELALSLIHISEPTRPLYLSYAVFCLKKKN